MNDIERQIESRVSALADAALEKGAFVCVAESLTGGMIAASLVDKPGSSMWFKEGFVTYSNEAKINRLGVNPIIIDKQTAVCADVAAEMATGALRSSGADVSVAVTGLAGPGEDDFGRPPGLVYIAAACRAGFVVRRFEFSGDRKTVRKKTNSEAVKILKIIVQKFV